MKNTLRYLLITAIVLGSGFSHAQADDKAAAAIGGFLAGIITGAIIENNSDDFDAEVRVGVGYDRRDYGRHDRSGRYDRDGRYDRSWDHRERRGPDGYWEIRRVKVWVGGSWEFVRNSCGERVKIWRPGHYTYRTERVWVASRGRQSGGYGHCG